MDFPVVALCGSLRFHEEFRRLETELTRAGHVVLAPVDVPAAALDDELRALLSRLHRQRIAMADEVLVVNVDGYVGAATAEEIAFARSRGTAVRFLESVDA